MQRGLVGSEMCIRDSSYPGPPNPMYPAGVPYYDPNGMPPPPPPGMGAMIYTTGPPPPYPGTYMAPAYGASYPAPPMAAPGYGPPGYAAAPARPHSQGIKCYNCKCTCLLYTSDAADDTPCVDLGGRRIIKKKKKSIHVQHLQQAEDIQNISERRDERVGHQR
eukprot:TRINITY_DN4763_c0_g1_i4.p1 TRINITY_DN4763_c0_g1~~TRINITY_DN4763_c0_g1_i4.p1  ORF type:complete len:163 (-),score=23.93 TRINITY_DN4763_c0_g1_i4:5-493(-)